MTGNKKYYWLNCYKVFQFNSKFIYALLITATFVSCATEEEIDAWYEVEFESLCDKNDHSISTNEEVEKYGQDKPYGLEISESSEFKSVSFKFLAECCLEFSGKAKIKQDTLKLQYWNTEANAPCECICDYKLTYNLYSNKNNWKKVGIKKLNN